MTKKEAIKNEHARNYWHYTRQAAREIIKNHNEGLWERRFKKEKLPMKNFRTQDPLLNEIRLADVIRIRERMKDPTM